MHAFWVVTASTFWSPYVAVGLAVLVLGAVLLHTRAPAGQWLAAWSPRAVATGHVLAAGAFPIALFGFMVVFFMAAAPTSMPTWIFEAVSFPIWLLTYLLRHAPALLALGVLYAWRYRAAGPLAENHEARDLSRVLVLCLILDALLLCLAHGRYNDWAMRTTLPVWMLLTLSIGRILCMPIWRVAKASILVVLAASSAASLSEIAQGVLLPATCPLYGQFRWKDMGVLQPQYQGLPDSLLYRSLARER
jgi:hypothetical protein